MTALDEARADVEAKYIQLGKVLQSSLQPGIAQMAAKDFAASIDNWAELRRSGKFL